MLNYRFHREYFPNLCEIEKKSITFTNFYSSATSTLMVISDLAYQGLNKHETFRFLGWNRRGNEDENSLLDDLFDKGYDVALLRYPPASIDLDCFVGKRSYTKGYVNECDYHNEIFKVLKESKSFVLWLCNHVSHLEYNIQIEPKQSGIGRWRKGYEYLDKDIGYIFDLLQECSLLSNTTVILYGDHGDDIYSHGYHSGLTHAVEPYAQLVHVPMFIYDERFQANTISSVASISDIGNMVKELLAMPNGCHDVSCFPIFERRYAVSRNMYASQRVRRNSFEKGYSVTDGQFLLLVNSRGMAMYEIQMDPTCQNDLLSFYKIDNNRLSLDTEVQCFEYHFKHLMDEKTFEELENKFYELRHILYKTVEEIYQNGKCLSRFFEMDFNSLMWLDAASAIDKSKKRMQQDPFDIFDKYFEGKKIVLYGAGNYGSFCYQRIKSSCRIVAWVDRNYEEYTDTYDFAITSPETILERKFDFIYIAITDDKITQSVFDMLVGWGIDENSIIL